MQGLTAWRIVKHGCVARVRSGRNHRFYVVDNPEIRQINRITIVVGIVMMVLAAGAVAIVTVLMSAVLMRVRMMRVGPINGRRRPAKLQNPVAVQVGPRTVRRLMPGQHRGMRIGDRRHLTGEVSNEQHADDEAPEHEVPTERGETSHSSSLAHEGPGSNAKRAKVGPD